MTTLVMHASAIHQTSYPVEALREWAISTLGAKRCSAPYLQALAIVLGNMACADLHGVRLLLTTVVPWATRATMRTLLKQLCAAKWVTRWRNPEVATYAYSGHGNADLANDAAAQYIRIQRDAEEVDFKRFQSSIGIVPADCPY